MTDNVSPQVRSWVMAQVRGSHTAPEVMLRQALWAAGARGWRNNNSELPGKPDIVFRKHRVVVFIDGCFWHGCKSCYRRPSTNVEYWTAKLARNKARDRRVNKELRAAGWKVIRVWEHALKKSLVSCAHRVTRMLEAH